MNAAAASKLAITSVNGGSNPTAGSGFAVVVRSTDGNGNFSNVVANTNVTLSLNTGTGVLGGTLTGTILAGTSTVTISGVTYTKAESGVILTATRTSGDTLTAGNSAPFTVNAAGLDNFLVNAPGSATAGSPFSVTVTARDQFNNTITGYVGTVHFAATGSNSVPANYTFVAGDNGVHTFTNGVTLNTSGTQTITVNDTVQTSKTGSANVNVSPAGLDNFLVNAPGSATAGSPFSVTVTARDQFNNTITGYVGTVHFAATGSNSVPANYTFVAGDNGVHTFTNGVTLNTSGTQTITVNDTVQTSKTGSANVSVSPAALDHITISPSSATINAGGTQAYTSEAFDVFGNSRGDVTGLTTFSITPDGSCTGNDCGSTVSGAHTVTGEYLTKTDDASLQIDPAALDHITISPSSATINAGGTQAYTSEAFDVFGNSRGDVTGLTTFSITPDGSCTGNDCGSTVSGAHTVTGEYLTKTDDASLQIDPAALDHITISPSSATINAGGTQAYTSEAFDVFGNSRGDVTGLTTFSITPDGSCTGNDCGSTVSGAHTVTGEYLTKTDDASLQIDPAALDHITISPSSATINAGGTQAYTSEAFDVFGNSRGDVTGLTTFSITPDGSCTGNDCGSTVSGAHTVTGEYLTKTDDASLQIDPAALDHITISPSSATINAGGTQAYTSEAFDVYGNSRGDVTGLTTFSITPDGSCTGTTAARRSPVPTP